MLECATDLLRRVRADAPPVCEDDLCPFRQAPPPLAARRRAYALPHGPRVSEIGIAWTTWRWRLAPGGIEDVPGLWPTLPPVAV
jgi:hypothetical protein